MVNISGLAIHFGGKYLFEGVSATINFGDRIGLIGRNGTGKSTLLKIIAGVEQASEGNIHFPKEFSIGYLQQDIAVNSDKTVYAEAESALVEIKKAESLIIHLTEEISNRNDYDSKEYLSLVQKLTNANDRLKILGGHSAQADVEQILLGLGFMRNDFYKQLSTFSGGWQMRVELAKILLAKPDCILLDEPTNHLDIESIRWLEEFLKSYPGIILLVSHDRKFLDIVTNRTIEISLGKVYDMPFNYSRFMEQREQLREQEIAAYKNQQRQIAETERFIERFRSKATLASRVQSRVKQLDKIERLEIEEVDSSEIKLRFPEPPRSGRLVVELKNLSKSYGDNLVLNNIEFAIERGEKVAFVGKNGEVKSTLTKIMIGSENYLGDLEFGHNVSIGYFAQHQAEMLSGEMNVFEVIDNAATGDMRTKVRSLLGAFLFSGDSVYKKVKVLSGGEKSRLSLAKLLLEPVNFLILDEPTNHLDMAAKDVLKRALMEFQGALIVVSHDRDFLEGLTQKTVEFKGGKIKEYHGDINYFLDKLQIDSLKTLEQKTKIINEIEPPKISENQISREKRKELQKEENKLNKLIEKCENEIAIFESEIAVCEKLFADPEFYSNQQELIKVQEKYKILKNDLDSKMQLWEELQENLEKITAGLS